LGGSVIDMRGFWLYNIIKNRKHICMTKGKGVLQKFALVLAAVSFALALTSGVMLYLRLESVGGDNPISASFMASTFFFIFVGVVFIVIGKSDIPSFKIESSERK